MEICAPVKDMETKGTRRKGHRIYDDPVVLQPVNGGYLVVTAWGNEASDENVINHNQN